jgi:hypothetical protein
MQRLHVIILFALALVLNACTKEIAGPATTNGDILATDLSGYWNAYGYTDQLGLVPLEIIKIERSASDQTWYTAWKIVGDNSVPGGMITWEGAFISNPFYVTYTGWNGSAFTKVGAILNATDANTIVTEGQPFGMVTYTRRSDGYIP